MTTTRRKTASAATQPASETRPQPRRRTATRQRKGVPRPVPAPVAAVDAAARRQMIAEAAYYLAEQRGFHGDDPRSDWLLAEAAIDRMLEEL